MRKIFSALTALILILSFICIPTFAELTFSGPHRIIIDTDNAGDDATAITMCVKAPNITVVGVTVLTGNVNLEQGTKNALMTLVIAGAADIPVYAGADTTLDGKTRYCFSVFGEDGMGDMDLIHPTGTVQEGNAVDFILETMRKEPDEIEILAIGPVTNIAMAILKDPETMSHVKRIWSMGTAGFGPGNATPVAEFNVYNDAQAYQVVCNSGIPMTVIGLDMTKKDEVLYTDAKLLELGESSPAGAFIAASFTKLAQFMKEQQGQDICDCCDANAAVCLIWDDFMAETKTCASYVCAGEDPTEG